MRVSWIDILKCFAIYTVVAGHMMSCEAFGSQIGLNVYQEFILAFHMPLFTILSGWFFKEKPSFVKNKCIGILLPYIVWSIIWYFVKPLLSQYFAGCELHLSSIVWQMKFFLYDGLCCYGWWFLRGLFFCCILAYFSVRLAEKCGKKIAVHPYLWGGLFSCIVLHILTFCGIIPNQLEKDSLLKGFIYMYPFFWAGFGIRQLCDNGIERFNKAHSVILWLCAFAILLFVWNGKTDTFYGMNTSVIPQSGVGDVVGLMVVYKTIFRFIVGVVGSFALILLFSRLFDKESKNKARAFCQSIGKETLGIYILQSLVYWSLPNHDILGLGEWGNFCFALLISVVISIVSYYIIKASSKNKWLGLVFLGKK